MNKRDYSNKSAISRKRHKQKRKNRALLVSLILLLTITVGGTIAFIYTKTEGVKNTFNPSKVTCSIEETFDGKIKSNVSIKNTGDTEAYIRAKIIVNWMDTNGNISAVKPVANDYSLTLGDMNNWLNIGGYYYYTSPVGVNASTDILISKCEQLQEKEGYLLSVEILAEAIQSTPSAAVEESWNVTIAEDGTISNQEVE